MATILFFGKLSDISATQNIALTKTMKTVSDLADYLGYAQLREPGIKVAVNKVMTDFDAAITDSDEIAFMSPLSGG